MSVIEDIHRERKNLAQTDVRCCRSLITSLETTHAVQLFLPEEQCGTAADARIRRKRASQIATVRTNDDRMSL